MKNKKKSVKKAKSAVHEKVVKVPSKIEWTSELSVHEPILDKQHQAIISKFNELTKDADSNDLGLMRGVIAALDKYHLEHFSYEEAYMKKHNFPGLKRQQELHGKFNKFFIEFKEDFEKVYRKKEMDHVVLMSFANRAKKYIAEWLVSHILHEDMKYVDYIEKHSKSAGNKKEKLDMSAIKASIQKSMKSPDSFEHVEQIKEQRAPLEKIKDLKFRGEKKSSEYTNTGISGFDELFEKGIPQGNSVLIAGGAGSGKTIFCLQMMVNKALEGKKCVYMTLEEREDRLINHMAGFGWPIRDLIKKNMLKIIRINPFDITRNVDAMLAKEKGELLIDIEPVIMPKEFKPEVIVVDSLTAIASAFAGREDSYRIYIEQLFRFFEKLKTTTFLITETKQVPDMYSTSGVEEFLADGVVVLYNIKRGDVRENAVEVLKMRGAKHQKKIVAMQITDKGIVIYPEQEVFGGLGSE